MATKKPAEPIETKEQETASAPVDPMKELTTVFLPRATGKEENFILVGLNGKVWKIMKGVPVQVPRPVAAILAESNRAERRLDEWDQKQQGKMFQASSYL
jgi:hypothetical protein